MATTIKLKRTGNETTAVSVANAKSLAYAEPAYCSKEKILYIGTEVGDGSGYGEFVAVGEDTNYLPSTHPAKDVTSALVTQWNTGYTHSQASHIQSLDDLSDVTAPSTTGDDGKVLSYSHPDSFTWVAAPGNTDENVSTAVLTTRLAELTGTITIGLNGTTTTVVKGNLQVDGTTTTINSTTLDIDDKNIVLAKGSANSAAADDAGITIDCGSNADSRILFDNSGYIGPAGVTDRVLMLTDNLVIVPSADAAQAGVAKLQFMGANGVEIWSSDGTTSTQLLDGIVWKGSYQGDAITTGYLAQGGQFNQAFLWGDHGVAGYLTSQTSHADVLVDGDFSSNGLMDRTGAGTYTTREYLTANFFKGLHDPVNVGTAGQLLTSEASAGFSWTTVGGGASEVAAGNHNHTGVYAPVAHTHSADDITGGEVDGGTF